MAALPQHAPSHHLQPTGDATIDAEHDAILEALDRLLHRDAMPVEEVLSVRGLLASHFATEEAAMGCLRPDRREAHIQAHGHFLHTLDSLADAIRRGEPADGARAYPLMLWFIVHSNTADAELAEAGRHPAPLPDMVVMKEWLTAIGVSDPAEVATP